MDTRAAAGGQWEALLRVPCQESPTLAPRREMLAQAACGPARGPSVGIRKVVSQVCLSVLESQSRTISREEEGWVGAV